MSLMADPTPETTAEYIVWKGFHHRGTEDTEEKHTSVISVPLWCEPFDSANAGA